MKNKILSLVLAALLLFSLVPTFAFTAQATDTEYLGTFITILQMIAAKKAASPDMEKKDIKKASQQALTKYRQEAGSVARSKRSIQITDREWEAIQAGAISENKLKQILDNTDVDVLRQRATPRSYTTLTTAKVNRIKALSASGKTLSEIAKVLGVSTSTVSDYLKGVS